MTDSSPSYTRKIISINRDAVPTDLAAFIQFWQDQLASLPSSATEVAITVDTSWDDEASYDGFEIIYKRPLTEAEMKLDYTTMTAKKKAKALASTRLIH